ncbi:MAG: DUF4286 family protein [Saprospiraceae bacterium]|nr:DUF4286 family protein [Saprospiraceae bacterium]HMW39082.1 DUF4286 family protein [Saprospiraceae bacterium]HMX87952.1 DUF4286 family protein [Saprospiraceae bacterium]HMZ39998.1 DUF4286 family protein [Saprospiraceae bacterium]HNA63773.1 DUF4286 family protein [Saprospiraceae bacterium]
MVVYNVTIKVDPTIAEEWMQWMRLHHIPQVLQTGVFTKSRISKLDIQEADGITYVVQYDCYSQELLNTYMIKYAPTLQKEHIDKFAGKFVAFRTVLQIIEEIYPVVN